MKVVDMDVGPSRLPKTDLSEAERHELEKELRALKLLHYTLKAPTTKDATVAKYVLPATGVAFLFAGAFNFTVVFVKVSQTCRRRPPASPSPLHPSNLPHQRPAGFVHELSFVSLL